MRTFALSAAVAVVPGLFAAGCGAKPSTTAPAPAAASTSEGTPTAPKSAEDAVRVDHTVVDIDGKEVSLKSYRGKALLIVNTASECGYTPQYADLELLYREYRAQGLEVLAFPSNDFGGQEPGDADDIKAFTEERFDISFPLFGKVHARGPDISPLYKTLSEQTEERLRGPVQWNFTKFLVDPDGKVVARFDSGTSPTDPAVKAAVEQALPKKG
ncbi:MAG: glutathione peroxidase [Myxococcota bacterium]